MTSNEELIARVREAGNRRGPWPGDDQAKRDMDEALDTLSRRIEELREGLERIAGGMSLAVNLAVEADSHDDYTHAIEALEYAQDIARSLLHPEPQEKPSPHAQGSMDGAGGY